jgi:hypothetical protein
LSGFSPYRALSILVSVRLSSLKGSVGELPRLRWVSWCQLGGGFCRILCISEMCSAVGVECVILFIALMVVLTFCRCFRRCLYFLLLVFLRCPDWLLLPLMGCVAPILTVSPTSLSVISQAFR